MNHMDTLKKLNEWSLQEILGIGGMSEVYLAQRNIQGVQQQAAIKIIRKSLDASAYSKRFLQEQQILSSLHHPSFPKLLDNGTTADDRAWFAMEYISGQSVRAYCEDLDFNQILRIIGKIAQVIAITHAHGIIHRDIKPSNIMITGDEQIYVLDFGVSKWVSGNNPNTEQLTGTAQFPFTIDYAAPELLNHAPATIETDIYQLAVITYEIIAGQLPFCGHKNLLELQKNILHKQPQLLTAMLKNSNRKVKKSQLQKLDQVLQQSLSKKPKNRQHSMYQFAEQINRVILNQPVENNFLYLWSLAGETGTELEAYSTGLDDCRHQPVHSIDIPRTARSIAQQSDQQSGSQHLYSTHIGFGKSCRGWTI